MLYIKITKNRSITRVQRRNYSLEAVDLFLNFVSQLLNAAPQLTQFRLILPSAHVGDFIKGSIYGRIFTANVASLFLPFVSALFVC